MGSRPARPRRPAPLASSRRTGRPTDIARAVQKVSEGLTVFPPAADGSASPLSSREQEVLDLVAGGATNREIAAALHLSPHTVKEYTSALYRKLDVRNRAEAVQRAQRMGLLA